MVMTDFVCPNCGRTPDKAPHHSGVCYPCHLSGIGFTFQGGGGYGRSVWNDRTLGESIREMTADGNAEYVGRAVLR